MQENMRLDRLTPYSVSIKKQWYQTDEFGVVNSIGEPNRKAYMNNASGRLAVESEVTEPYKSAIFAVWGDAPTVDDPSVD